MKKFTIITLTIAIALVSVTAAFCKDTIIETEVQKIYRKVDKNGEEYVRLVVSEERRLNGISYPANVLVMAFSDVAEQVANVSVGDKIKAIVAESSYNGSKNYRLVHVIK